MYIQVGVSYCYRAQVGVSYCYRAQVCVSYCYRAQVGVSYCYRAQELCKSQGGRLGLPIPDSPYGLCGRKATLEEVTVTY